MPGRGGNKKETEEEREKEEGCADGFNLKLREEKEDAILLNLQVLLQVLIIRKHRQRYTCMCEFLMNVVLINHPIIDVYSRMRC